MRSSSAHRREALVEGVPRTTDGADRVGFAAAIDGLAQAADVDVDRAFVDVDVVAVVRPQAMRQTIMCSSQKRVPMRSALGSIP